jgi:transposase
MTNQFTKKLDFIGQNIYVGIDVHKKSWQVMICNETMELKNFSQPPQVEKLVSYLKTNYPNANYYSAYEAGFSGFWAHNELMIAGINNLIVNPADVPSTDKDKRQKRDPIDSRKIAKALRKGELESIHIPAPDLLADRSLVRTRTQLTRDLARTKNRIKSVLYFNGIVIPEGINDKNWSKSFLNWLKEICENNSTYLSSLPFLMQEYHSLELLKKEITKQIKVLAETKYKKDMELIRSIPGIGIIGGITLLTELGDIKRFKRLDDLCGYVGLVPDIHGSGEKEYVKGITKRGNKSLQPILIECAWKAVKKDPALLMTYNKLIERMKGNKAIIRIARKLLSRIRWVLQNNQSYEIATL